MRAALGVIVLGSLLVLVIYASLTEIEDGVKAPLYALIAATGLAVVLGARAKNRWESVLNLMVQVAAIAAAVFSAYNWLRSEDAGTGLEIVGAAGAFLAGIAFSLNLDNVDALIKNQDSDNGES